MIDKLKHASKHYPLIEIIKRSFDKQYCVYQYMSAPMLSKLDLHEYGAYTEEDFDKTKQYSSGCWILINVFRNKKIATEYFKSTYGNNCFKNKLYYDISYSGEM